MSDQSAPAPSVVNLRLIDPDPSARWGVSLERHGSSPGLVSGTADAPTITTLNRMAGAYSSVLGAEVALPPGEYAAYFHPLDDAGKPGAAESHAAFAVPEPASGPPGRRAPAVTVSVPPKG